MNSLFFRLPFLIIGLLLCLNTPVLAAVVAQPDAVEVLGLICRDGDGAAWIKAGGQEILVTPGFMLARDLRVTAIEPDGIVMHRPKARTYHVAKINLPERTLKTRTDYLSCTPMTLWKIMRMFSLAYRKDFVCHHATVLQISLQHHGIDMNDLLDRCMYPHHRRFGREGTIYVAPVHVGGVSWTWFLKQVKSFRSQRLARWFPKVDGKGTIISNGRQLADVLRDISWKSGVPIRWDKPVNVPLYCSFKEKPWHEILENIILYNGLILTPAQDALVVSGPWPQAATPVVPVPVPATSAPVPTAPTAPALPPALTLPPAPPLPPATGN